MIVAGNILPRRLCRRRLGQRSPTIFRRSKKAKNYIIILPRNITGLTGLYSNRFGACVLRVILDYQEPSRVAAKQVVSARFEVVQQATLDYFHGRSLGGDEGYITAL